MLFVYKILLAIPLNLLNSLFDTAPVPTKIGFDLALDVILSGLTCGLELERSDSSRREPVFF